VSRLFREDPEKPGFIYVFLSIFCYLLYAFMWVLGYVFGIVLSFIGKGREVKRLMNDIEEREEVKKIIEKMNEQGPNN
jgi:uncharacterized membrane protein YdjX (TVP38/TMEM64 family)